MEEIIVFNECFHAKGKHIRKDVDARRHHGR